MIRAFGPHLIPIYQEGPYFTIEYIPQSLFTYYITCIPCCGISTCVHKGGFCIDFLWVIHPYDNRSVFTIETGLYFRIEKVGKVVVVLVVCCMFFYVYGAE